MIRHITVSGVRATRASNLMPLSPGSSGLAGRTTTSTRPARSFAQVRAFWDHSHRKYRHTEEWERRRMERYRRLYQLKMRRAEQPPLPKRPSVMFNQHVPWWIPGWGWGHFKSGFPESELNARAERNPHKVFWESNPHKSFWETESARAKERMEHFRREIHADPHAALFGSRLVRPGAPGTYDNWFTDLCRTFLGLGSTAESKPVDTTTSSRTSPQTPPPPSRTGDGYTPDLEGSGGVKTFTERARVAEKNDMEFDPISGRMVPKSKRSSDVRDGNVQAQGTVRGTAKGSGLRSHPGKAGFLSSVESSPRRLEPQGPLKDSDPGHGALYEKYQGPGSPKPTQEHKARDPTDLTAREKHPDATTQSIGSEASPSPDSVASPGLNAKDTRKDTPEPQGQTESNGYLDSAPNSEALGGALHSTTKINKVPKSFVIEDSPDYLEPVLKEKQEDLDILTANDIRASYEGKHFEGGLETRKQARKHMEDSFDSYVDPASDIDPQCLRQKYQETTEETGSPRKASSGASSDDLSQPEASSEQILGDQTASDNTSPDTYLVLAYDPSTRQIKEAETSSSLHSTDGALHPTKVLRRLHHPAKFLPYFAQMHHGGYEIVSGGGDILVFRKTREAGEYGSAESQDDLQRPNPYVRHEDLYEPAPPTEPASTIPPTHNDTAPDDAPFESDKDTPESTESPKARSRFGSALRRMFISGAATAATCYAIGVVVEFLRTGGEDGRGFDAFTEFESERRQRERNS